MTRWRYAAGTDTGLVRQSNQDAVYADGAIAIVADGMGGHAAGEVASALTIETVLEGFEKSPTIGGLHKAIERANTEVLANARANPERAGMGTTIIAVGLTIDEQGVTSPTLFHVGDSRAYQLRDGALRKLSDDHSVAEEWVRKKIITPEEALVHPDRHMLTRGIGVEVSLSVDVMSLNVQIGDRVLLCSDGLSNELSPDEIARIASAPGELNDIVAHLIRAAKESGGRDNISAVLLEFDDVTLTDLPVTRTLSSAPPPRAEAPTRPVSRRRGYRFEFTWRVAAAFGVIVAVVVAFFAILNWYAYSNYYLGNDNGMIAVYKGQPGGVLWFHPQKVLDTQYEVTQLRSADQLAIEATINEPSLGTALNYAAYLHSAWQLSQNSSGVTTTTTTTTVKK